MIVVFKHEDMSNKHLGEFYEQLKDFILINFKIRIDDSGNNIRIYIDEKEAPVSYTKEYTREEAIHQFCNTQFVKDFIKSRFYTVYETKKIV